MSIYSAELYAIRTALPQNVSHSANLVIFTDCKSGLQKLKTKGINYRLSWEEIEIKTLLCQYRNKESPSVHLTWIPGHSNIVGNEVADSLAKEGLNNVNIMNITPSIRDYSHYLKGTLLSNTRISYPWFIIHPHIKRKTFSIIENIRFKTALTPAYKFLIRRAPTPYCDCGQYGDIEHIIQGCPRYFKEISMFLDKLYKGGHYGPIKISNLLLTNPYKILLMFEEHIARIKLKI